MTTIDAPIIWAELQQKFTRLAISVPDALRAEMATLDESLSRRDFLRAEPGDFIDRAIELLAAGKDPATDKTFQASLARVQLRDLDLFGRIEIRVNERRSLVLRTHAEAVIGALAEVVDQAEVVLSQARREIRGLDLRNDQFVTGLRPEQMALWGSARQQLSRVTVAEDFWRTFVIGNDLALLPSAGAAALILADLDAAQVAALGGRQGVDVAHAGHPLKMAGVSEYQRRLANLRRGRREGQVARDQERARQLGTSATSATSATNLGHPLATHGAHL